MGGRIGGGQPSYDLQRLQIRILRLFVLLGLIIESSEVVQDPGMVRFILAPIVRCEFLKKIEGE